uniref:Fatty acid desaturase domain-containing protein n=1 Tax=Rhodosorus marinus TaxID=101924 RepID=A0A7S3EKK7_9RHOD|mmetsp:Transcript_43812/g.171345  ORF Transcript_43812/g.171345 Transcript_43812/m.171345 type:complete len:363 (+) Transcript_43812:169-1257(+)
MAAFVSGVCSGSFLEQRSLSSVSTGKRVSGVRVARTVRAVAAPVPQETREGKAKPQRKTGEVLHKIFNSDVEVRRDIPYWSPRKWVSKDWVIMAFVLGIHLTCLAVPFTMSWTNVALFTVMYIITGMLGITLTYHRLLSHRAFKVPKPVEYFLAYCGVLSCQGDPITWVKDHRHHHKYCDTDQDVHSPFEGFWWSHAGWLLNTDERHKRLEPSANLAADLDSQPFYKFIKKTYFMHLVLSGALLWSLFGWGGFVWGFAFRAVWVYHITWFVNSASHVWGYQSYNTGDISMNNWWVGILAFGEGWHNNHHAFEYSARHGLEWWQYDPTWWCVRLLQMCGLATNVKLPSEAAKERLAIKAETPN